MLMPFAEPTAPRYIYINPETNQVHLLVPVVGGQEISTDNTCKSTEAMDEFFRRGAALRELNAYKAALEFDLQFIEDGHPLKDPKQARLTQINEYLAAIPAMQKPSKEIITSLLQVPSNLYSIHLRPKKLDNYGIVINPVFSLNRDIDATGRPKSALYNALHAALPNATIVPINPRATLNQAVLAAIPEQPVNFEAIQHALTAQCQHLFGLTVDFTQKSKESIDELMKFTPEDPPTTQDYMDALLGTCASEMWEKIPVSPFYGEQGDANQIEKFSMLTQFFLANANVYSKANGISDTNFGTVLDASTDLSNEVTALVVSALGTGSNVEDSLCTFFNEHAGEFSLNQQLTPTDTDAIKQKFDKTWRAVTATKDNPRMDDYMILDTHAQTGKFVMHQGSICVDCAELTGTALSNTWAQHHYELSGTNEHIKASVDLDIEKIETLVSSINDEQFEKLSIKIRLECMKSPAFQLRTFLHDVARGRQDEAEKLLADNPERTQALLTTPGTFTDYSGRTFNCTAYEYAYWAKDAHMCRMLEAHMDEPTKAAMLTCCEAINRDGLRYRQHGVEVTNPGCFKLDALKSALQNYIDKYNADQWNENELEAAWMQVGLAQRDLPVHVINEYCRPDWSFDPLPTFSMKDKLPRVLTYYNFNTSSDVPLFPLVVSGSSGLGVDFALIRARLAWSASRCLRFGLRWLPRGICMAAAIDLAALSHLDVVRTDDLKLSLEILGRPENLGLGPGFR